ncbi:MAG TPA: hypothetical protein VE650_11415 [Acetobacteraceae bacterium]|nr:hypothetical protein [Acetobacteraceae bacterium]
MAERTQLPLAFPHRPNLTEADFLPNQGNRLALEFLAKTDEWPQRRLLLWGAAGTGKSHLLHIWACRHGAGLIQGPTLDAPIWPGGAVAIDDIDQAPSEPALLHLLNAASEAGLPVLMTAARPPGRRPVHLADLASRLRATNAVEIGPADEAFLATLLAKLLAERQLRVPAELRSWLLTRLPRTPSAIQAAVAQLDQAALAAGAAITRKLAERALAGLFLDGDREASQADPPLG